MKKNIKKYAFSYKKFDKFAAGEGLRYLGLEFTELESDVNDLMNKYFKALRDNKRVIIEIDTLKIIHGALVRIKAYLDNYYKASKDLFSKFKKSIVRHDREKLVKIFGTEYMQFMDDLVPGKSLGEGPKYKAMMELVNGEDKELMEKALNCLFEEPAEFGAKYQEFVSYFNKVFSGENKGVNNYDWVSKYGDLFKFAKLPSYFNVRHLFPGKGQTVEFGEENLDVNLNNSEKTILQEICNLWDFYKSKISSLLPLVERAYLIDRGYLKLEEQRNEELHSIFDRIRALRYMISSYILDGGTEKDFYDKTGFTFSNAYAKMDNWVFILLKVFPSNVSESISKKFIKKMPRTITKNDSPYFSNLEESFFENKDYESGDISGTQEGDTEVLYREQPEDKLPVGGLSSYRGASEFNKALNYLTKIAKK